VTIATTISRFGLDNLLVRNVASYSQQAKWSEIAGLSRQSLQIGLCSSIVFALLITVNAEWIAVVLSKPAMAETLRVMAWAIVPLTLMMLCGEMLKGMQKVNLATFIQLVGVPLVSGGVCFWSIVGLGRLNLSISAIIYVLSTSAICILSVIAWVRSLPQVKVIEVENCWALLRQSSPFFGVTAISLALNSIDILLLGIWTDSQTVAIYSVATRMASLTAFFLGGVNSVVSPKFSILYAHRQYDKLAQLAGQASALTITLTLPLLIPLVCFPKFFLSLFGTEYGGGAVVLVILVVGQFFNALTGSVGCLLLMTGHEKLMRLNLACVAVLSMLVDILAIPRFGIVGAATVSSLSLILLNLVSVALVYKRFSIIVSPFLCFNLAKN
jgi:O-antigen/teichoic acid export membrane protein